MTPPDRPHDSADRREASAYSGDLFGELHLAQQCGRRGEEGRVAGARYFPGLAVVAVAAGTAAWLAEHYGLPIMLLGLLIGLALNFAARDQRIQDGLELASRGCLRIGIVLLGLQVTFAQVAGLGLRPFAALLAVMAVTFAAGIAGAVLAGQSRCCGILAGGATAICGASAALALYAIIGRDRLSQAQFALTLVSISLASALAMSLYPAVAAALGMSDAQAAFLMGASIHDVAQALGAGFTFSDAAGTGATVVKLVRVALLGPVVMLVGLWIGDACEPRRPLWRRIVLPWFLLGFIALVGANSLGLVPEPVRAPAVDLSKALLLLAVIATAMRSDAASIMGLGWRAGIPTIFATFAGLLAAAAAVYLIV